MARVGERSGEVCAFRSLALTPTSTEMVHFRKARFALPKMHHFGTRRGQCQRAKGTLQVNENRLDYRTQLRPGHHSPLAFRAILNYKISDSPASRASPGPRNAPRY